MKFGARGARFIALDRDVKNEVALGTQPILNKTIRAWIKLRIEPLDDYSTERRKDLPVVDGFLKFTRELAHGIAQASLHSFRIAEFFSGGATEDEDQLS